MTTLPLRLALVVSLGLAAGCGSTEPRLSLTKYDQVQSEIERVSKELDASQAAKLKTAAEVLAMHAMMSATSEDAQALASVDALNGKTPSEVIAAYEKLGPEVQLKIGQQIATARAESPLKEANDYRQKAIWLHGQMIQQAEKYEDRRKSIYLKEACIEVEKAYTEKQRTDGDLAAAKWLNQEYEQGPEYLINTYPGASRLNE